MKSWLKDGLALVGAACVVGGVLAYDIGLGIATAGLLLVTAMFLLGDDGDAAD